MFFVIGEGDAIEGRELMPIIIRLKQFNYRWESPGPYYGYQKMVILGIYIY